MAWAPLALMIAGTAVAAVGTLAAASNSAAAHRYNADMAKQNAVLARQAAAEREARFRRESRQRMGAMRAGFAGQGLLTGSAIDALADSAAQEELEALSIRYEGELQARGYTSRATTERTASSNARIRGYYSAAATSLRGAGTALNLTST